MKTEDQTKLIQFLETLVSVQGNVSIDRGILSFEDGSQADIGELLDILIIPKD